MADHTNTFDPVAILEDRFANAIARAFPDEFPGGPAQTQPLIAPAKNPDFGDFQSNAAMPLAKRLGSKPRDVAGQIVERLDLDGIGEAPGEHSIAGPGFINVRLVPEAVAALLDAIDNDAMGIEPDPDHTVIVDLCGVNLAKQMHVGHLRATVIGDAVARLHERLGRKVIRQNHVGDWGLPIAMVTQALDEAVASGSLDLETLTLDTLDALYKRAQLRCRADSRGLAAVERFSLGPKAQAELEEQVAGAQEALERAKQRLVALQSGDEHTVSVWQKIYDTTMRACLDTCARLDADVTDAATAGESTYRTELAEIVDDLESRKIAEEDDGALIVRNTDAKGKAFEPTLIRKSDGGFLYATTDLAGIRRRVRDLGGQTLVYCVDARQSLHFRQVFASATKAGYATGEGGETATLIHAAFGTVLGEDNKPFKTRSGENVKLSDLLDEGIERALKAVVEKNPELPAGERDDIARAVGIAAIKYADLSLDRARDYVFSFDRMVSFEGNTGPYLLFALVRIRSLFRRAGEQGVDVPGPGTPIVLADAAEKSLALELLRFPGVVRAAAEHAEPHRMCTYLYDLASTFSTFIERCPVLKSEGPTRDSRMRLCAITERALAQGLESVGIRTLERM